jgi:hypothetical protein
MLLLFLESLVLQQFLNDAGNLTAIYWRIRNTRFVNKRRKWYRKAAKEKARLAGLGYHPESIRLYALHLRDTTRENRLFRFEQFFEESQNFPKQLTLF